MAPFRNPEFARAYHRKGEACRDIGNDELALKNYIRATELDCEFLDAFLDLGDLLRTWENSRVPRRVTRERSISIPRERNHTSAGRMCMDRWENMSSRLPIMTAP